MKIISAVMLAVTISCALAACESSPKPPEIVRLVKARSDLADLGVAGYRLHQPLTAEAPGMIEFLDANRVTIGKMTSSTVHSDTSVSTTMTIEGLGAAEPLAITDETVGDGTLTRVIIQRGAQTTTYEHDAAGTFLVVAGSRIAVDDEHEAELSAALTHTGADPRFRVFAALSQDPRLAEAPGVKGMFFNHKSPLCTYVLGGAVSACITVCMAVMSPAIPITLPACLATCGIAAADWAYCQYEASIAVNDAQCDANSPPGYIGRADATEHQCIQRCDQSRCDGFCRNQPQTNGGYCSFDYCTCTPADETDDSTGGGGGGGGGGDGFDGTGGGGGGSCTWCDCTSEYGEFHGTVCGDTTTELIDECWGSC